MMTIAHRFPLPLHTFKQWVSEKARTVEIDAEQDRKPRPSRLRRPAKPGRASYVNFWSSAHVL